MCANVSDVEAMDPALVLTLDSPAGATSLRCVGTLDRRTRRHLVAVIEDMLRSGPDEITIDVERLRLADSDAANALTAVQRMARRADVPLRWRGVGADLLRRVPALEFRTGTRRYRDPVRLSHLSESGRPPWRTPRPGGQRSYTRSAARPDPDRPADAPPRAS